MLQMITVHEWLDMAENGADWIMVKPASNGVGTVWEDRKTHKRYYVVSNPSNVKGK